MGKRKEVQEIIKGDDSPENLEFSPGSHKKHKKHKKKHRKRPSIDHETEETIPETMEELAGSPKGPIKLKFKFGQETLGTKNVVTMEQETTDSIVNVTDVTDVGWENNERDPTIRTKKAGEDTSDEEKEWLSALEKGELDDYGEISKGTKDPSLMTARQRALKHGNKDQELLQLPTGYRNVELTEEQLKRREQRAHKRKQMAQEKREKDKKQTLDRLLKKQDSRMKGGNKGRSSRKADVPKVTYLNRVDGITISVPNGIQFPFEAKKMESPKQFAQKCGIRDCNENRKYACSKTGIALCSLKCYKKNLSKHKHILPVSVGT